MSQGSFFDFRDRLMRPPSRAAAPPESAQAISVSQLTTKIDAALRVGLPQAILVRGELSNFSHHRASGHMYFTLKDDHACIDCVMFKTEASRLKFTPTDGSELLATGSVRVYAQRGRYQLYVTNLSPLGKGALELAFQQLKEKLQREGLFAAERKRVIPRYAQHIAIVTGRNTAALQDVLKVLRRFPFLRISLFPVLVQGDGAAEQIAQAIESLNTTPPPHQSTTPAADFPVTPQLILLCRGGGSLEDLWAFNEEVVARAIAESEIPIITGIGHEVDVSIADLVADYHAHTPTEAAQVAIANWRSAGELVQTASIRQARALRQRLLEATQRLRLIEQYELFRRPADIVDIRRQRLDDLQKSLVTALRQRHTRSTQRLNALMTAFARQHPRQLLRLSQQKLAALQLALPATAKRAIERQLQKLNAIQTHLTAISPQATLGRGYSITSKKNGAVVRNAAEIKTGDVLLTRFADGQTESVVRDNKQMRLFE